MSDLRVIEAVKQEDAVALKALLGNGEDVHERDPQGWTPLNWAAGKGTTTIVQVLLEHGADPNATGRDLRTPLMIAKAARHKEVIEILHRAQEKAGIGLESEERPYCKAYHLGDVRRFDGWPADGNGDGELTDDSIVYLHQDLSVTRSMWHGEDVIFDGRSSAWQRFCTSQLDFEIPEDLL